MTRRTDKDAARTRGRDRDRITPAMEDRILGILREWKGPLTGDAFAARVSDTLRIKCTRQGLLKRETIRTAFDEKRKELEGGSPKPKRPAEIDLLLERVKAKEAIIAAKDEQIRLLKQTIVRHHYNARDRGISETDLEKPIPPKAVPEEERPRPGRRPSGER